jgi:hypothetical protein
VQPLTSGSGSGSPAFSSGSATVYGEVWLDNNGDGSIDNNELGYDGATVVLWYDDNGTWVSVASTTTDSNGDYSMQIVLPSLTGSYEYELQVVFPRGFEATIPGTSQINAQGYSPVFQLSPGAMQKIIAGLASMTVTTTADDINANGAVAPIQNQITLRDAIQTGNNGGGILSLTTVNFTGNGADGTISLKQALPAITRSYNILGPTTSSVTVEDGGANNPFGIFDINAGVTSTISQLSITKGYESGTNGGGIYNAGTLTLTSDNVYNNSAAAVGGVGGQGGGIYNAAGATLTLDGGEIHGNDVGSAGGGILNAGSLFTTEGTITEIYKNSAEQGGGIASGGNGTAKIVAPTDIYNNGAAVRGGGVFISGGTVTITGPGNSGPSSGTIQGNKAPSGGGIYVAKGVLSLQSSVRVQGNSATTVANNPGVTGGGMYLAAGTTTGFYGVTVSGNSAPMNAVEGVAYEKGATLNNVPTGLTDKDDPNGKPVQV